MSGATRAPRAERRGALARSRDDHLFDQGPKRILCLDGGGLRGSLTLGILKEMEGFLRRRHGGDPRFRLSDYFDLIAGTSTGAIIAATLARGMSVEEVYAYYAGMGEEVFKPTLLGLVTLGLGKPRYKRETLERYLKDAVGAETTLGDETLETGLLVVAKRIDTHSVWALANNRRAPYFSAEQGSTHVPNHAYPLWELLRASAAAPTYFDPVALQVADIHGDFIDGGMSPYNDPSFQAFLYATVQGFGLQWPSGPEKLLMVSVGTGSFEPPDGKAGTGIVAAVVRAAARMVQPGRTVKQAFFSLLKDNQDLTRMLMQWMSWSPTATPIDSAMGDLKGDLPGERALLSFVRFDARLERGGLDDVLPQLSDTIRGRDVDYASLTRMDEPRNVDLLWRVGRVAGAQQIRNEHFPAGFDLAGPSAPVLRAGVVGHRHNVLGAEHLPMLTRRMEDVLARLAQAVGHGAGGGGTGGAGTTLCVVSALAEGADRIAARVALEQGYALECPLPFDRLEYLRDFESEESRLEFKRLIAAADVLRELPGAREAERDAYAAVGQEIARSDVLVALWDGEQARGRGGTAEVVRAAAARIPVVWIHAESAVEPCLLRLDGAGDLVPGPLEGLEAEIERIQGQRGLPTAS